MMRFHIPQGDGRFDRPLALLFPLTFIPYPLYIRSAFLSAFPEIFLFDNRCEIINFESGKCVNTKGI